MSENDTVPAPPPSSSPPKKKRGFALMPKEWLRETASKGGHAAQATGKTHRFTKEQASEAGKKGGKASAAKRRANRESSQS